MNVCWSLTMMKCQLQVKIWTKLMKQKNKKKIKKNKTFLDEFRL